MSVTNCDEKLPLTIDTLHRQKAHSNIELRPVLPRLPTAKKSCILPKIKSASSKSALKCRKRKKNKSVYPIWDIGNEHICGVSSPVERANDEHAPSSDEEDEEEFAKSTTQLEFPEHPPTTYDGMCLHKPDWCSHRARGIIPGIPKHKKKREPTTVADDIMLPVCGREQLNQTSTVAFQKLYGRKKHVTSIQRDTIDMIINPDKFDEEDTVEQEKLFTRKKSFTNSQGDGLNANNSTNETVQFTPMRCESIDEARTANQQATQREVTVANECAEEVVQAGETKKEEETGESTETAVDGDAEKRTESPCTMEPADCKRAPKIEAFLSKKRHLHGPSDSLYVNGFDGCPVDDGKKQGLRCGYPWSMSTLEHYLG